MIRPLRSCIAASTLALATASGAAAQEDLLPRPAALEPRIQFWTRIYTGVTTQAGLIHDSDKLDVVYELVRVPQGLSDRARERHVNRIKKRYRNLLRSLARGKRENLDPEEERVLGLWPEGVSNATLKRASRRIRFQLGQADKFRAGLIRSGAWRDYIAQVLAERNLPAELLALPHVESSYNTGAYSRAGAAGLWQFTRSTGRRYMRVDHVVDERLDVFASTRAAAKLLEANYRRLKTWPLAITAYNHGTTGTARAVRKHGTRDLSVLLERHKSRTFGFASRNFYCEFLAALDVERDAERYFGRLRRDEPIAYDTVVLEHYFDASTLAKALGVATTELNVHNPALRTSVWNGSKYVPRGFDLRLPLSPSRLPLAVSLEQIPRTERHAAQRPDRFYKVRRGDSLSKIARRFHVSVRDLVRLNSLRSRHRIHPGQVLRLPTDDDDARGRSRKIARLPMPSDGVYTVRRGDSLFVISQRFAVSEANLVRLNRLRNRNRIAVGQTLRLVAAPKPSASSALSRLANSADGSTAELVFALSHPTPDSNGGADLLHAVVRAAVPGSVNEFARAHVEAVASEPGDATDTVLGPELGSAEGRASPRLPLAPELYAVAPDGTVEVQAEETLGHYAEWLETRASRLRRLNRMGGGDFLDLGRRLRLDFSRVDEQTFEGRRLEYHRDIQEDFFAHFRITGTTVHALDDGESLWQLARDEYELPLWLIRQLNPELDYESLNAGDRLIIPVVAPGGTLPESSGGPAGGDQT